MKKIVAVFKVVVTLAALYFIVRAVVRNAAALGGLAHSLNPGLAAVAVLCSVVTSVLISVLWTAVVHPASAFERRFNFAYAKANLIRYIPGNILGLGARILFANRLGVPKTAGSLSIAIEGLFLLLTTGVLSFLYLAPWFTPFAAVGGLAIALLFARNFRPRQPVPSPRRAVALTFLYFGYGLGLGLGLFALARGINADLGVLNAIGLFSLAWFLGYASLLTPSGLGVREGTIVLFLGPALGIPTATFLAIGSRLAIIVSEVLVSGLYWILNRGVSSQPAPAPPPQPSR